MKAQLSILMPVYNAAPYLAECLDSILQQSYTDWELIAVDDFSTDASKTILENYAQRDNRIQWLSNTEKGIISALRLAYQKAQGDFIHRMDADDLMPPYKLEQMAAALKEKGPGSLITGKVEYFAAEGISEGYRKYQDWLNALCSNNRQWEEIYKECVIASPAWMIHRADFNACGAFDSDWYPEDYDLVFRFYKEGLKVHSLPEVIHLWRDHAARSSRNHEHYQQNAFYELKVFYFLQLDHDPSRPLVIWGAGRKGKLMARLLQKAGQTFEWVSNNPEKEGKDIYGTLLEDYSKIIQKDRPQILITVAQREAKKEILAFMKQHQLTENKDFYFFS